MKEPALTIVVPFLNEQDCLPDFVAQMNRALPAHFPNTAVEVVFVDDGSCDQSMAILRAQNFTGYQARLLSLSRNFGSHAALRAGIFHSRAPVVTFLMADLQDPPEIVRAMFDGICAGFDVVWARRLSAGGGFIGRRLSLCYAWMMRKLVAGNYPESGCDVVMIGAKVKHELNQRIEANSSVFLQLLTMGFTQSFVEYHRRERSMGESKWTFGKKVKLFVDSFVAFSYAPIRMVSVMGLTVAFGGFVWLVVILIQYFNNGGLIHGWAALIAALMIGFGATNISLGIIAEYLWRTLDAARGRKVFIVKDDFLLGGESS